MDIAKNKFKDWFDKFSIKFSKVWWGVWGGFFFFGCFYHGLGPHHAFDKDRNLFLRQVMEYESCIYFASAVSCRRHTSFVFFSVRID